MPTLFSNIRGSTNGYEYITPDGKKEIWFIVHITHIDSIRWYQHQFVIFDDDMNLLRYSPVFKFESNIEFCLGLIINHDKIICCYST